MQKTQRENSTTNSIWSHLTSHKKQILTIIIFVNQNEKKKTCENQIQINSSRDLIISSDFQTAVNSDSETNISSIHVEMKIEVEFLQYKKALKGKNLFNN